MEMKILDWDVMKNGVEGLIEKKIVLYGTSSWGDRMLNLLRYLNIQEKIICVCDTNKEKWGTIWNDLNIISPIEMCNLCDEKNAVIVICSSYEIEIYKYLIEINCKCDVIGSKAYIHAIHYSIMNNRIHYFSKEIVEHYKETYNYCIQLDKKYIVAHTENENCILMYLLLKRDTCILAHSVPKTGNMTLKTSLSKYSNAIMSLHSLYTNNKEKELLLNIIKRVNPKVKILTGIRYPIERIISLKWEFLNRPWLYGDDCLSVKINNETDNLFKHIWFANPIRWFKEQIEEPFGIDVFQYPFDVNKGYTIIYKDNISIFLYRLDYLNNLEKEIGDFIGYEDFKIIKDNQSENKAYALAYQEYLKELEIDSEFFESLISSKEMYHFFSESERENYRKKWLPYLK